ncbi:hypothetical protein CEXT_67681 [Caerostris extrusa]|uniref:Uncharacterized protein n=1 Tax=Caerostris extrusa TaxID=172846 RepID=A0AAV4MMI2_CAEEX|nr:hypothetical protein CEXT_67681 [Caerostris extrusa]
MAPRKTEQSSTPKEFNNSSEERPSLKIPKTLKTGVPAYFYDPKLRETLGHNPGPLLNSRTIDFRASRATDHRSSPSTPQNNSSDGYGEFR